MKRVHFHTGVETIIVVGTGILLYYHGMRFIASRLVDQPGVVGRIGAALGSAFSFPAGTAA